MGDNSLKPLDDSQVEGIAGGYISNLSGLATDSGRAKKPYAVIDDGGDVVASFRSYDSAIDYANANGYSTTWLNLDQLQKLRETGSPE